MEILKKRVKVPQICTFIKFVYFQPDSSCFFTRQTSQRLTFYNVIITYEEMPNYKNIIQTVIYVLQ